MSGQSTRVAGPEGTTPAMVPQGTTLEGTTTPVTTPEGLAQVEAAEAELRRLGFPQVLVRHHGQVARLEVPAEDVAAIVSDAQREEVRRAVRSAGFRFVTVDLAGPTAPG